jgi:O-antigen/teichoic acid export membrane protein
MKLKAYLLSGFLAKVGFTLTLFLVNMLIARVMGAADSGAFFYTVNNLSIIVLLASLSLESGLSYHLSKKNISEQEAASLSVAWSFGFSLLTAIAVLFIPGVFSVRSGNNFWFAFLFIAGNLLTGFFSGLFYAKKEFAVPLLVPSVANLLVIIYCGWVLFSAAWLDSGLLLWIYFLSYLFAGLLLAILFISRYPGFLSQLSFAKTFNTVKKYSGIAFTANLIAFLVYRVDYWILEYHNPASVSGSALGNYIQVAKLVQLFLFAPTVIATVIFPLTASKDEAGTPGDIKKILVRLSMINLVFILIAVVAGSWLFPTVYGKGFDLMYSCFLYLIPGILAITLVRVLASYFAGLNKMSYNITGGMIALVLIVTLNFLLIPKMGINGAALADSIGYAAYLLFLYYQFRKTSRA